MDPVAFTVFGQEIRWYGILIAIGVAIGGYLAIKDAKRYDDIGEDMFTDFLLWVIPLSIVGARIYYVIFRWDYYSQHLDEIIKIRNGGLAIHGGILMAMLVAFIFARIKKVDFWDLADIAAPGLILGQAIGRWGNYANGEAHGGPTDLPWAITVDGVKVHPTFLYESLWNFAVFLFLYFYLRKRKKFSGQIFLTYLMLYSFARFFIEGLRTDSLMIGPLRQAQVISIVLIVVAGAIYYHRYQQWKKSSRG